MKNAKKYIIKHFKIIIIICMLSQMISIIALANVNVNVTPQKQEKSNWCWAATSVVVARYYGKTTLSLAGTTVSTTQTNHAIKVQGNSNNNTRSLLDVKNEFLDVYNIRSSYLTSSLSGTAASSQLYSSKPILIRIQWVGGSSGHLVLMTGYLSSGSLYRINDPLTGGNLYHTISTITSAYPNPTSNATGTWTHTVYSFSA